MKCPVCDNVNTSMVCLKCGFDSSRDYEQYPTFMAVGQVASVSAMRKEWQKKPKEQIVISSPLQPRKKRKLLPLLLCTVMALLMLLQGILAGSALERAKHVRPWENNVLRTFELNDLDGDGELTGAEAGVSSVFGSADYRRDQIRSVTVLDSLDGAPEEAWDVSETGDGTVLAWVKPDGELYDLYLAGSGGISAPKDAKFLFAGYTNAVSMSLTNAFHTEAAEDLYGMFYECGSLASMNLSTFDMSAVRNMGGMFYSCSSLRDLILPDGFVPEEADTTDMYYLCPADPEFWKGNILRSDAFPDGYYGYRNQYAVFGSDYKREEIGSVTVLDSLEALPADAWDVSESGDGRVMAWVVPNGELYDLFIGGEGGVCAGSSCEELFSGYKNATHIDLGERFDTSSVQDMSEMFSGCDSLQELVLGDRFDTSNVQDMSMMFNYCDSLQKLNLGDCFDTSNVQDMSDMFYYCRTLTELTLGNCFDTSNVQDMRCMFFLCTSLSELTLGDHFDTSKVQDMSRMFSDCGSLEELTLGDHFDTTKVQNMSCMFSGCNSLQELTLGDRFDTSKVQDMNRMFSGCYSLEVLTLGDRFDTSNVQDMRSMFYYCESLTELTLGDKFVTTNADTTDMFHNCPAGENYTHLVN